MSSPPSVDIASLAALPAAVAAADGPNAPPAATGLRVFIVEDSAAILDSLRAALQETAGVQVVGQAADEPAARRALLGLREAGEAVGLLIIDVFLRAGSGLGLLGWAAQGVAAELGARCVVLTNYATADMRDKCLRLGAQRVFDKTSEIEDLLGYCLACTGAPTHPGDAAGQGRS